MSEHSFFQDLAMLMSVVGFSAVVFSRLGWPKVLGYILAGVLMSEHTWGGSLLNDVDTVRVVGQLGIVFLMFGMGLSFSPKDMRSLRSVALPTAVFDTVVMVWLGYAVGTRVFGWSPVRSVFLGVAICDSATTMLAKVLDEMGWMRRQFAKYALGTSVCEDIVCVGAIAVVTGFANGVKMSVGAFLLSLGGLALFFLTVLVFGFIFVPRLLKSVSGRKDDEALVLALLGVCFFISYFAYQFEFSLALGAFLVGLLGSVSDVRQRIGALADPLKSMFSAMFFVSIGLLVDPAAIWSHMPQILVVSAVVMAGKCINVTAALVATGLDVKTAVQAGFSLAQIGEFAFMVAIIYANLFNGAGDPMFQIAVGASLLTTMLNPLMVKASERVGDLAVRRMPDRIRGALASYRAWIEKIRSSDGSPTFARLKSSAIRLCVYAVLILSVSVICSMLHTFDYSRFSTFFERHDRIFFFFAANIFAVSLLPLVLTSARSLGEEAGLVLTGDGNARWQVSMRQLIAFVVVAAVLVLFFVEWTLVNVSVLPVPARLQGVATVAVLAAGVLGWRFFVKAGRRATQRFQEALTVEERRESIARTMTITVPEGAVQQLRLGPDSPAIGETVVTLNIRAKTGATVVSVQRGGVMTRNVGPDWEFRIGDIVVAIGDSSQIAALKDLLGVTG